MIMKSGGAQGGVMTTSRAEFPAALANAYRAS